MTASDTTAPERGSALWRDLLNGCTAILLFVVAVGHMTFVVPVFRVMLSEYGVVLSWPARLAVILSRFGALLMLAWAVALVVSYWRDRRAPAGRLSLMLAISALLLTVYLVLVTAVYVDAARWLPVHLVPAQHTV